MVSDVTKRPNDQSWRLRLIGEMADVGGVRWLAVAAEGGWPERAEILFRLEGIFLRGEVASGPEQAFLSALSRWPETLADLGHALARLLGASCRLRTPMAFGDSVLEVGERTIVMGVLNVTPDSFYDGGRYLDPEAACRRAHEMIAEGADVIDVGGESTRPGADPVPAEEEIRRVIPVIQRLAQSVKVPISIDTYKAEVAEAALKAGASIVNDVTGLQRDPAMPSVAAAHGAAVVVMHSKGDPRTMQRNPTYDDVVREVREYLERGCELAINAGVLPERIWIDPGIGFGKTVEHNLTLLRSLRELRPLGFPILVGTSNKSVIGNVLGVPVTERVEGTAATVSAAIAYGADGVRVHDVRVMRRVCDMTDAVVRGRRKA